MNQERERKSIELASWGFIKVRACGGLIKVCACWVILDFNFI